MCGYFHLAACCFVQIFLVFFFVIILNVELLWLFFWKLFEMIGNFQVLQSLLNVAVIFLLLKYLNRDHSNIFCIEIFLLKERLYILNYAILLSLMRFCNKNSFKSIVFK